MRLLNSIGIPNKPDLFSPDWGESVKTPAGGEAFYNPIIDQVAIKYNCDKYSYIKVYYNRINGLLGNHAASFKDCETFFI